jgi:hypothetical protein
VIWVSRNAYYLVRRARIVVPGEAGLSGILLLLSSRGGAGPVLKLLLSSSLSKPTWAGEGKRYSVTNRRSL